MTIQNPSRQLLLDIGKDGRTKLAATSGVGEKYLYMVGVGIRNPSRKLSIALERADRRFRAADFDDELRLQAAI